jgi:cytochrome b involved in lipid metabolism
MFLFRESRVRIKIDDNWYDVTNFVNIHPGGEKILKKYNNKDATNAFYSINKHYNYIKALDEFLVRDNILIDKLNKKIKDS